MTEVFTVEVEDLSEDYCGCHCLGVSSAKKSYGLFSSALGALEFVLDKDKPIIKDVLGGEDWLLNEPQVSWPDFKAIEAGVRWLDRDRDVVKPEAVTITVRDSRFEEDPHKILLIIDIKKVEVQGD